jgi:predicted XRE-type DNA-binding protein
MNTITINCTGWSYAEIRGFILLRDKGRCRKCGSKKNIEVHHKKGRIDNTPKSLITLCRKCHNIEHGSKKRIRIPLIKKIILDNNISLSYRIAPLLGVTQSAVSQILNKGSWHSISRAISLVAIVNTLAKTNHSVEEMFSLVESD